MGLHIGSSEAETFWSTFLKSLVRRGLRGTKLLISDAHEGLKAAIRRVMSATWQRYRVHWMRKALAYVPKGQQSMASAAASLRQAFGQNSPEKAQVIWHAAADQMRQRWPKLGVFMDDSKPDVLAYMGFPDQHRAKLYSTNALERLNKGLKRRADTVGIFPSETVEVHDDQGVAGPDVTQQPGQHGPAAVGAGGVLFQDGGAARGAQLVALWVGALLLGRDPRVAHKPAGNAGLA